MGLERKAFVSPSEGNATMSMECIVPRRKIACLVEEDGSKVKLFLVLVTDGGFSRGRGREDGKVMGWYPMED